MAYNNLISVLKTLSNAPADVPTLIAQAGISRSRMYTITRNFQRLGLIKLHSYRYDGRQRWSIFELSDGTPDMRIKCRLQMHSIGLANMWKALEYPCTVRELMETVGYGERQTQTIVRKLRDAGLVRIASWDVNGDAPIPEYQRGQGKDAARPKRMKRDLVNKRWREAHKAMILHKRINGMAA